MSTKGKSLANTLIIIFSFMALGPIISILVSKLGIANDRFFFDEPLALSLFLLVPVGLLVIIRFLLRWRGEGWADIGLSWPKSWTRPFVLTLALIVADILIIFAIGPVIYDVTGSPPDLSSFEPLIGNLGGLLGIIVFGWAMGGFTEEILFRGYLMRNLADLFGGKDAAWWGAALLSSLLFSLPHLYQGAGGAIQTGLLALVSAAFFIKGGRSLVPLILAHGILNTVSFTSIYMGWGWA